MPVDVHAQIDDPENHTRQRAYTLQMKVRSFNYRRHQKKTITRVNTNGRLATMAAPLGGRHGVRQAVFLVFRIGASANV